MNIFFNNLKFLLLIFCLSFPHFGRGDSIPPNQSENCTGGLLPEVLIPSGRTEIASPSTRNPSEESQRVIVTVAAFCVSQDEVSVEMYQACVNDEYCAPLRGEQTISSHPAHSVTYSEMNQFLLWLSSVSRLEYRLPSEAEWQRAALGGLEEQFPWRSVGRLPEVNIFSGEIAPVGESSLNEFGVRDAIGNLSEIVSGCFARNVDLIPTNGSPFEENNCRYRLTKGGHYSAPDFFLRPYFRAPIPANFRRLYT